MYSQLMRVCVREDECVTELMSECEHQIKSLLLSHHHSTSALVSEILMSVLQTVQKTKQKKQQFTYGQYIFTDYTEDNVQNTHTYTQYTQCTIKTYLIINYTLYTVCAHLHYVLYLYIM